MAANKVTINEAVLKKYDLTVVPSVQHRYFPVTKQTLNLRTITTKQVEVLIAKGDRTFVARKNVKSETK